MMERAFNQINGFELISDHYVSLNYQHYFEGFLLNKIPLLRYLSEHFKWRLVGNFAMIYGGLRPANRALNPATDAQGMPLPDIGYLDGRPYMEAGYGFDNIFRFFRIDFIHRLTYLERPSARPFGIKLSAEIKF